MRPIRILLIEDDPVQAEWLAEEIIWSFDPSAEVRYFDSEYSAFKAIEDGHFQNWVPDCAIIDLLMRYYSPNDLAAFAKAPDFQTAPKKAECAGIRCANALRILYPELEVAMITVLDTNTIPDNFRVIQKGSEELPNSLTEFLRSVTTQ